MKIAELTQAQLETISGINPGYIAEVQPQWLYEHHPELLKKFRPAYSLQILPTNIESILANKITVKRKA